MAYTPTEWVTGDVITAEKLNKMEDGIESASSGGGGGGLIVNFSNNTPDKTTAEIAAAASAGQIVVFKWSYEGGMFIGIANITLSNGSMTEAKASAVNDMYDGMMSTITYELGSWSTTGKYFS